MKQKGFTLIELIAVIVILGILSATAIPQFLDLRNDARNAAAAGVGGGIASATAMNYARGVAQGGATTLTTCAEVATAAVTLIPGATVSGLTVTVAGTGYLMASVSAPGTGSGAGGICSIVHGAGGTAQQFMITRCNNATCS